MTEQEQDGDYRDKMVLFRCTECGKTSTSLGWLHAHIENHVGIGPFGLIPNPFKTARFSKLMELTEVMHVEKTEEMDIDEVCRECEGEKRVGILRKRNCPTCGGTGVRTSV